jgi:hypothetical protein
MEGRGDHAPDNTSISFDAFAGRLRPCVVDWAAVSVVRPEFGPTLPELIGPRVRALPRALRVALAAVAALVVLAAAAVLLRDDRDPRPHATVRAPIAFNLLYLKPLERVTPRGRETLRLQTPAGVVPAQSFAVTPMKLPPYRGDVGAVLLGMSGPLIQQMSRTLPGFVWRGDGRVNYNRQPGYEIQFQARIGGRTMYGRRTLLVPGGDTPPRAGADIMMLAARAPAVPNVNSVASKGPLKAAIRSFLFGTKPL